MAEITLQSQLDGTTVKSVLTLTNTGRTSTKINFSYTVDTNLVYSSGYIGAGESLNALITVSGTGVTTKNIGLNGIKTSNETWSGTEVHTKSGSFDVDASTLSELTLRIDYAMEHQPSEAYMSDYTAMDIPFSGGGMKLKTGGEWKSCVPMIRVGGVWRSAAAFLRINGEWKEGL